MHADLEAACKALEGFAAHILSAWSDDRTLIEAVNWQNPALTRQDLAGLAKSLAGRIRMAAPSVVDEVILVDVRRIPAKMKLLQGHVLPNFFNGHGHISIPAYTGTLNWIETVVSPLIGWQTITDPKSMPAGLARKVRSFQAELDQVAPNKASLTEQIRLIKEATDAAENLPTNLQALSEAQKKIESLSNDAADLHGKIKQKSGEAETNTKQIVDNRDATNKLVVQCEEAYRITTTKGLAAAFDQRAEKLSTSMSWWVFGLLVALAAGAWLGSERVTSLSAALSAADPKWGVVWMNAVLSMLSIGAPLWFAWLATKQIGHRFRLSEDYAFKASVAKAYEGYKKEAAHLDKAFEARLFGSALN